MGMILQNLRSTTPGVAPSELAPGQLCFNVADDVMFIGDGSSFQTSFDGAQTPVPLGTGWFSLPLTLSGLSPYLLQNPEWYGDIPADGDVLTFSSGTGKPVWLPTGAVSSAYATTNAAVAAAPGGSTSAKISNALAITPVEKDTAIVSGAPGDQYQGYYIFMSGNWTFAAGYADPTAIQVPYNNSLSGLVATTVQAALDELSSSKLNKAVNTPAVGQVLSWSISGPLWVNETDVYPTAAQVSYNNSISGIPATNVQDALTLTWQRAGDALQEANSAQEDATAAQETANIALNNSNTALVNSVNAVNDASAALNVANSALPRAGGTMTGDIVFHGGQPVDAGTF
jgi:hypothetical protein